MLLRTVFAQQCYLERCLLSSVTWNRVCSAVLLGTVFAQQCYLERCLLSSVTWNGALTVYRKVLPDDKKGEPRHPHLHIGGSMCLCVGNEELHLVADWKRKVHVWTRNGRCGWGWWWAGGVPGMRTKENNQNQARSTHDAIDKRRHYPSSPDL